MILLSQKSLESHVYPFLYITEAAKVEFSSTGIVSSRSSIHSVVSVQFREIPSKTLTSPFAIPVKVDG
jgi:hypothetical protein